MILHTHTHTSIMNDQPVHEIHTQTNEYIHIRAHSELRENIQHIKQHIIQNKHLHPLGPSWSRHPVLHIHMDDTRQIQAPTTHTNGITYIYIYNIFKQFIMG